MKRHLGTVLIIVGLLIVAIPLYGRYQSQKQQREILDTYLNDMEEVANNEEIDSLNSNFDWANDENNQEELNLGGNEAIAIIDEYNGEDGEEGNVKDGHRIKQKPKAIGIMDIPKIGVFLPIADGVDLATLKFALGRMPSSAKIGQVGNCVVAGHRCHSAGVFFNRLDELVIDDKVTVKSGGKDYIYKVYEILVVEPTDTSVLRGSKDSKVLTLITCTPKYKSTHRLIVHAVLEE